MDITIAELAVMCGTVLALYTFYKTLKKDFNSMLDAKLNPLRKDVELSLRVQAQAINHLIDGNHTEKLKTLRDELEKELVARKYDV